MDKILTRKLFRDVYLKTLDKQVSNFNKGGLASLKNQLEQYAPKGEFLAYINKKEANVLKALGGSGKIVKETGIPSFAEEDNENSLEDLIANSSSKVDPKLALRLLSTPDVYPVYSEGDRQAMLLAPIASQLLTGTQQPGQSQLGAVASNVGAAIPKVMETSMQMRKLESDRLSNIAKLAKSSSTVPDPYSKAWQTAQAKKDVESYDATQASVGIANQQKNEIAVMRQLFLNPNLTVGALGESATTVARIAQAAGLDPSNIQDLKSADLLKQLAGKTSLTDLRDLKGAISDKEGAWIRSMNPSVASTREGALAILDFKEKVADRQLSYAKEQADWVNKYGSLQGKDKEGKNWNQKSAEFLEKNTVLDKKLLDVVQSPQQQRTSGAGSAGATFRNPADGKTYIKGANGKWELAK
jgi:hypothetical protein